MTALALVVALLASPLPEDPVERVCAKALAGTFGALKPWQREGYRALAKGHKTHRAWRTYFDPTEPGGKRDRRGRTCTLRTASSNRLRENAWVLDLDHPELRQIMDCGAQSNDADFADPNDCSVWVDFWVPHDRWQQRGEPIRLAVSR